MPHGGVPFENASNTNFSILTSIHKGIIFLLNCMHYVFPNIARLRCQGDVTTVAVAKAVRPIYDILISLHNKTCFA